MRRSRELQAENTILSVMCTTVLVSIAIGLAVGWTMARAAGLTGAL